MQVCGAYCAIHHQANSIFAELDSQQRPSKLLVYRVASLGHVLHVVIVGGICECFAQPALNKVDKLFRVIF